MRMGGGQQNHSSASSSQRRTGASIFESNMHKQHESSLNTHISSYVQYVCMCVNVCVCALYLNWPATEIEIGKEYTHTYTGH